MGTNRHISRHSLRFVFVAAAALAVAACADDTPVETGEEQRITVFSSDWQRGAGATTVGVNDTLWRASLDTLSFMPIRSTDPFGGTILTDWHELPERPDQRVRMNVRITDRNLSAGSLRVNAFRQTRGQGGEWVDADLEPGTVSGLETAILRRAREIRAAEQQR